ncbi:MAG: alcohol dehydrogenase catalytic domain-containing protein [Oscillospiraceae bacterium]|nr:alcohol dehydrogenase catalytic domain-containing protein [Oscillospiraceae bacterium]
MRAGFMEKPGLAYFIDDAPEPQLPADADNWVKIRVKACGICGSEVHAYHGVHPFRIAPLVSGHEFSGVVAEVGPAVTACKVGDRVTAEPQYGCGTCYYCRTGRDNLCSTKKVLGASYWSGPLGEYVVVPEKTVVKLADNVSFEQGALIEPIANAMYAVRKTPRPITEDTTICILGAGPIGLGDYLCIKPLHPKLVALVDIVDFNLEVGKRLGCEHVINNATENLYERAMELTDGLGFDMVFLAFGDAPSVQQAAEITKRGGILQLHAAIPDGVGFPYTVALLHEVCMQPYQMYQNEDFVAVADAIASGRMQVDGLITHRYPIEQFADAMKMAADRPEPAVKVMMHFD